MALTIAGSDSSGGAGIQADLKTFHAFGVFGTSAITAITVQNTLGVQSAMMLPAEIVADQIRAVTDDMPVASAKTGMLGNADIIRAVAKALSGRGAIPLVLDPVMIATSGDRLLDDGAESALVHDLIPLAQIITPNLDEAEALTKRAVRDVAQMEDAARRLVEMGAKAALVKGGHLQGGDVVDVFYDGRIVQRYSAGRVDTIHTHGTGCTLSAAIAAGLAAGASLQNAVEDGLDFVRRAIADAPNLGRGRGPLNHFVAPRRAPA